MALPIEQYAVVGDGQSMALVGRDGSIDWLCLPRFDSDACFAALLGEERHGRWRIAPAGPIQRVRRRYRGDTLVLETELETADGAVRLIDFMPSGHVLPSVVRIVEGVRGRVPMRMELVVRFDYGRAIPWTNRQEQDVTYTVGPDTLLLRSPLLTAESDRGTVADFVVGPHDRLALTLAWYPSWRPAPPRFDPLTALLETLSYWKEWSERCSYRGEWSGAVTRSLLVLKGLTHAPTGGIVAAATTSLPEQLGGTRNWDYRYCWLRDSILTVNALSACGYDAEAVGYRDWMLRTVAGDPGQVQTMYGPAGERRLPEFDLDWLPGYEGSTPVRVGNAAVQQFQLDVFGEVLGVAYLVHRRVRERARPTGPPPGWRVVQALLTHLSKVWEQPDEGIWEVRGPRRHFTQSKVMAWFAFTCAARLAEMLGLPGPVEQWLASARRIHQQVCERGYDPRRRTFTQSYGSRALDASLLTIPMVGFLPPDDPRVEGTIAAIERELTVDGLLLRYSTEGADAGDGLPPGEGAFLPCSFWLVGARALAGRVDEARALFERLLALRNDVGLLSEEYDPHTQRLVGNFPQAFSHLALINAAILLDQAARAAGQPECDLVAGGERSERGASA